MYELELSISIILGLIGLIGVLLKKRPTSQNSEKNIEQRVIAVNNIVHLQEDFKEIKNDLKELKDNSTKSHAEIDKIHGKIHQLELQIAGLVK